MDKATICKIVKRTREILGPNGEAWTTETYAHTGAHEVGVQHADAAKFCFIGAAAKAENEITGSCNNFDCSNELGIFLAKAVSAYDVGRGASDELDDRAEVIVWNDEEGREFWEVEGALAVAEKMACTVEAATSLAQMVRQEGGDS